MPQASKQSQRRPDEVGSLMAGLLEAVVRSISLTVEVFLHRGFGGRYLDCGLLGVAILFFFPLWWFPNQDPLYLWGYMVAYGVMWAVAGISVLRRRWSGKSNVHSRYNGTPYLWLLFPNWKEEHVKMLEALAVILLGYGIHFLNRPLGFYLMMAAGLVLLRGYNLALQRRERVVEMNDRAIEQKLIAERFREIQEP